MSDSLNLSDWNMAKPGDVLWDRGSQQSVTGLHCRVYKNNKRCWYIFYTTKTNIQRRPKIGEFPAMNVSDARMIAKKMKAAVQLGGDPALDIRHQRGDRSVEDLFNAIWKAHWDQERFHKSGYSAEMKHSFEKHVKPKFGSRKQSTLTASEIREWHQSFRDEKPFAGNQALKCLSRLFKYAEEHEWRPQGTNPCKLIKPFKERRRKRYATAEELAKIGVILEREAATFPEAVAFLYILLFSGARPRAIERATFNDLKTVEVDGEKFGVLVFNGKTTEETGEEEMVVLPPQAMRIIDQLPRKPGGTLTNRKMPRDLWAKIKKEVGCEDLWARDARRTFSTMGRTAGVSMDQIADLLNHKSTQTTKRYAQLEMTSRLAAAAQVASHMQKVLSAEKEPLE